MDNQRISVVVPIYKVEAYLDRCVQSVVDQTYRNLEIILVDDGSPDRCPSMCDEWAKKDSRIKVIHKKNGGLSDARNAGMAVATGELMGFIDSDDWIEPNMYELLHWHMLQDQADISACGVQMNWENETPSAMLTKSGSCILSQEEAMKAIIEESWLKQPVWYKLYKTELIQDILFPVGKYHEDVFWSYRAVGRAKRVSVFDAPCYHYIQRAGSIMGEVFSLRRLDALEAQSNRLRYLKRNFPQLVSIAKVHIWSTSLYMEQMSLRYTSKKEADVVYDYIRSLLCEFPLCKKDRKGMYIKQRIWWVISMLSFKATCRIRNYLNKGL